MKRKLTLTVDGGTTHRAKILARQRGQSLSQLVQDLLDRETGEMGKKVTTDSFSKRWAGKMQLADLSDPRSARLRQKYGLDEDI